MRSVSLPKTSRFHWVTAVAWGSDWVTDIVER
jgi:hypothetical protein